MKKQNTLTPLLGYDPMIGRWLAAMEDARQRTKETLTGMDDTIANWSPSHLPNSIGTLLYHIAVIEMDWLCFEILELSEFPPRIEHLLGHEIRDQAGRLAPVAHESLATHLARLDASRQEFLAAFADMTLAEFRRARAFEHYDVTPEWVIHHLMQHESEHRGQIGELRILAERELTG